MNDEIVFERDTAKLFVRRRRARTPMGMARNLVTKVHASGRKKFKPTKFYAFDDLWAFVRFTSESMVPRVSKV